MMEGYKKEFIINRKTISAIKYMFYYKRV